MRILITNNTLDQRAGSELYVRDLALALLNRGHTPIAYSTKLGDVAREIRAATVPVVDNLDALAVPPDVIHGHHHLETMTALLRFPGVPAISFCHGWMPWEEIPPRFPRILQYAAVDHTCRDRLILESGIPAERVRVLLNFVDLERFKPREPLPARPQRALIFSNSANEYTHTPAVREACARYGITTDVVGLDSGNVCAQPEEILLRYDIVFAKGKAALEALAVGAAVVLCDASGAGPLVTSSQLDHLRRLNFGLRALRDPVNVDLLDRQIARYNAKDAAKVSRLVRASAGRDVIVDEIISLYREVIAENESIAPDGDGERRAGAAYLRFLAPTFKAVNDIKNRALLAESARVQLLAECDRVRALLVEREQTLQTLSTQSKEGQEVFAHQLAGKEEAIEELSVKAKARESQLEGVIEELSLRARARESQIEEATGNLAEKENQLERITNSLGWRLLSLYGPIKYRVLLPAHRSIVGVFKVKSHSRNDQDDPSPATDKDEDHSGSELIPTQEINQPPIHPSIMKEVFSDIYRRRAFGEDCESVSGPGSSVERTSRFRDAIPVLLKELNVRTLLDAGCGDFNWMKLVKLDLEQYIGVDVVSELISENQRQYGKATRTFLNLDISREKLPKEDLILSRDCLVHFRFKDVSATIKNFKESGSTYLLATTFPGLNGNTDTDTGGWRHLNLQMSPFNFPEPLNLIEENRTDAGGVNVVKYLGLWALKDIALPGDPATFTKNSELAQNAGGPTISTRPAGVHAHSSAYKSNRKHSD